MELDELNRDSPICMTFGKSFKLNFAIYSVVMILVPLLRLFFFFGFIHFFILRLFIRIA